jgi:hypothetical protein
MQASLADFHFLGGHRKSLKLFKTQPKPALKRRRCRAFFNPALSGKQGNYRSYFDAVLASFQCWIFASC